MFYRGSLAPALLGSLAGWVALICTAGAVMAGASLEFRVPAAASATLTVRVTDAADASGLPARIRVWRVGSLEPRRVAVVADGVHSETLAPGEYRVWASHGPFWSIAQRRIVLGPAERHTLEVVLERQVHGDSYAGCDLHVHSDGSRDSRVDLHARLTSAAAEDLQVAVITDHNLAHPTAALPQRATTALVPGVEVTSWDPEFGHFNVFPSTNAPGYKHSSPERLLGAVGPKSGRFVQVNHPRLLHHIAYFELAGKRDTRGLLQAMHGFDGLEVWNGYDLHRASDRDRVFGDWLSLIEHGRHVVATGGSDSHELVRNVIGYPRTFVELPAEAARDGLQLAAALRAGRAYVSNGPLLELRVGGRTPGDTALLPRAAVSVHVHLRVDAPDWMDLRTLELWVDGHRVLERALPERVVSEQSLHVPRSELDFELPVSNKAKSLLAVVRGERAMDELFDRRDIKPFAFTNPVWLARR
jgi:hypothetical protein